MKTLINIMILIPFAFSMLGCGDDGSKGSANKYIGEIPETVRKISLKLENLERKRAEINNLNELALLEEEFDSAIQEAGAEFNEAESVLNLPIEVPAEGYVDNEGFKLEKLMITGMSYNALELTAEVTSKVTRSHIFGYLQALDADGNPLLSNKDWAVLGVANWRELKEGEPAVMKGSFIGLEKLDDLEKFVFRPRSEYEKYN